MKRNINVYIIISYHIISYHIISCIYMHIYVNIYIHMIYSTYIWPPWSSSAKKKKHNVYFESSGVETARFLIGWHHEVSIYSNECSWPSCPSVRFILTVYWQSVIFSRASKHEMKCKTRCATSAERPSKFWEFTVQQKNRKYGGGREYRLVSYVWATLYLLKFSRLDVFTAVHPS